MSFFRHTEIFRPDRMPSVRRREILGQSQKRNRIPKILRLGRAISDPPACRIHCGYSQKTPPSPATAFFYLRERPIRRSPAHRLDEFPVGYSLASCSPVWGCADRQGRQGTRENRVSKANRKPSLQWCSPSPFLQCGSRFRDQDSGDVPHGDDPV